MQKQNTASAPSLGGTGGLGSTGMSLGQSTHLRPVMSTTSLRPVSAANERTPEELERDIGLALMKLFDTYDVTGTRTVARDEWIAMDMGQAFDRGESYDIAARHARFRHLSRGEDEEKGVDLEGFQARRFRRWARENKSAEQILAELESDTLCIREECERLGPRYDATVHKLLGQLFEAYTVKPKQDKETGETKERLLRPAEWVNGSLAGTNEGVEPAWLAERVFYKADGTGRGSLNREEFVTAMLGHFGEPGGPLTGEKVRGQLQKLLPVVAPCTDGARVHLKVRQEPGYKFGTVGPLLLEGIPGSYMHPLDKKNKNVNVALRDLQSNFVDSEVLVPNGAPLRTLESIIRLHLNVDPQYEMALLRLEEGKPSIIHNDKDCEAALASGDVIYVKNLRAAPKEAYTAAKLADEHKEDAPAITGAQHGFDYDAFFVKPLCAMPPPLLALKVGDAVVFKVPITLAGGKYTMSRRASCSGGLHGPIVEEGEWDKKKGLVPPKPPNPKSKKPPKDQVALLTFIATEPGDATLHVEVSWATEEPTIAPELDAGRPCESVLHCDTVTAFGPFTVEIGERPKAQNKDPLPEFWNGEQWGGKPKKAKPPKKKK